MSFYENRVEHYGGALVLFQRNLTVAVPNAKSHCRRAWYMRLKIGGRKGYITRSTKLTLYEDAYEFAKSELLRLQQAARLGHSMDEYTFEKHWNDWYERNLRNSTWADDRARWHKMYFNRYFKDYFSNNDSSSMLLNDITSQYAAGYGTGERTIGAQRTQRSSKPIIQGVVLRRRWARQMRRKSLP